jgi:hypothetical protein
MNHSDDLFMFHRRRISGLAPGQTYEVSFRVALASKYVSETGIGGDPAKSVYLKGCAATHEPVQIADGDLIRLNIDIGDQANAGTNSVVLGDIEKKRDGSQSYVMIERASVKPLKCAADAQGQMWLLFGTDSGYEGETSLYCSQFEAVIT